MLLNLFILVVGRNHDSSLGFIIFWCFLWNVEWEKCLQYAPLNFSLLQNFIYFNVNLYINVLNSKFWALYSLLCILFNRNSSWDDLPNSVCVCGMQSNSATSYHFQWQKSGQIHYLSFLIHSYLVLSLYLLSPIDCS